MPFASGKRMARSDSPSAARGQQEKLRRVDGVSPHVRMFKKLQHPPRFFNRVPDVFSALHTTQAMRRCHSFA